MKLLFLSQRFLLPMDSGGKIRTGKLLEQLARLHDITLISNVDREKDSRHLPGMERFCQRFVEVPWRETPRHSARYLARVGLQTFSRYPVSVLNDFSPALRDAVNGTLANGDFDLAICDFVQSALVFQDVSGLPTLLFTHNVESMILERHVSNASNPLARLFWSLQWRRMLDFEARACSSFDQVVAVSEVDAASFAELYRTPHVGVIPTGVDVEFFAPGEPASASGEEIVFCGSMDWLPNEDAMLWFIEEILPRIREKVPGARLTVVGRNPSPGLERLVALRPEVELTGWVDDTRPYLARAGAFVVPIRVGGGTRMKIYEGMAMGKAVVSTTVGAEGLDYVPGRHLLIADDAEQFASAVAEILSDAGRRETLGAEARAHVAARFSWSNVAEVFSELCERAVARFRSRTRSLPGS